MAILALVLCMGWSSCARQRSVDVVAHAPFLQRLGLEDVDKVAFDDKMEIDSSSVRIPVGGVAFEALLGQVARTNAVGDDEDGIFIIISERASRESAESLGEDPDETGDGELFSIGRVS